MPLFNQSWSNSTVGEVLALHAANRGLPWHSIWSPWVLSGVTSECRASFKPWTLWDMTPKPKISACLWQESLFSMHEHFKVPNENWTCFSSYSTSLGWDFNAKFFRPSLWEGKEGPAEMYALLFSFLALVFQWAQSLGFPFHVYIV